MKIIALVALLPTLLTAIPARADDDAAARADDDVPPATEAPQVRPQAEPDLPTSGTLSVQLDLLPSGVTQVRGGDANEAASYAIEAAVGWDASPGFNLSFAPRFVFDLLGGGGDETRRELELRVRLQLQTPLSSRVRLLGFFAPGYALLMGSSETPKGLVLELGTGLSVDLSQAVYAVAEVGYQVGFFDGEYSGAQGTRYLHLGVGVGTRF